MSGGFVVPNRNVKGLPNNVLGSTGTFTFSSAAGYQRITDFSDLALKALNDQLEQLWIRTQNRSVDTGDYSTTMLMVDGELTNPCVMGRKLFSYEKEIRYVSDMGSDCNDGLTQAAPFLTLDFAVQSLPIICEKGAIIYVDAPGGKSFIERLHLTAPYFGELALLAQNPVTVLGNVEIGPMVKGNLTVTGMTFYGTTDEIVKQMSPGAAVLFDGCTFFAKDGGKRAIHAMGGKAAAVNCGFYNCTDAAILASHMGSCVMHNCVGKGNGVAMAADSGGVGVLSGTCPGASALSRAENGGVIQGSAAAAVVEPESDTRFLEAEFETVATMSALDLEFLEDPSPAQGKDRVTGKEYKGYWVFDTESIQERLTGKTIVGAKLLLKRKPGAGSKKRVNVYLYLHNHTEPVGDAIVGGGLGNRGALAPDESMWLTVTPASVNMIRNGMGKGYAVHSPISGEELEFYAQSEFVAKLWVVYR